MRYRLGIDFGTSFTAAAICPLDGDVAAPEMVPLGTRQPAVPSVAFVGRDGAFAFGEAAEWRSVTEPGRVIREFKRHIGDPGGFLVDGVSYTPRDVAARFVESIIAGVAGRVGSAPAEVTVTHPAAWDEHRCRMFRAALADRGVTAPVLLTEPEAAALAHAADSTIDSGATVAVYGFGGGSFDAAIVRGDSRGRVELLGKARGRETLGGVDFDEAILGYVRERLGAGWDALDTGDPAVRDGMAGLRRECADAKEALSVQTQVTIPVLLPGLRSRVRITRAEFEDLIVPGVSATVDVLEDLLGEVERSAADLSAILLIGGLSRVPIIAQSLSDEFGVPVRGDVRPHSTVALGAALHGCATRAGDGHVGVSAVDLTPRAVPVEVIPAEPARAGDSTVRTYRGRTIALAGVAACALLAGSGPQAMDPSSGDGPREVIALPGGIRGGVPVEPDAGRTQQALPEVVLPEAPFGPEEHRAIGSANPGADTGPPTPVPVNHTNDTAERAEHPARPPSRSADRAQHRSDGRAVEQGGASEAKSRSRTGTSDSTIEGSSRPRGRSALPGTRQQDGSEETGTSRVQRTGQDEAGTKAGEGSMGTPKRDSGDEPRNGGAVPGESGGETTRSDEPPTSSTEETTTGSTTAQREPNTDSEDGETTSGSETPTNSTDTPETAPSSSGSATSGAAGRS